jgi:hypothetical protein
MDLILSWTFLTWGFLPLEGQAHKNSFLCPLDLPALETPTCSEHKGETR